MQGTAGSPREDSPPCGGGDPPGVPPPARGLHRHDEQSNRAEGDSPVRSSGPRNGSTPSSADGINGSPLPNASFARLSRRRPCSSCLRRRSNQACATDKGRCPMCAPHTSPCPRAVAHNSGSHARAAVPPRTAQISWPDHESAIHTRPDVHSAQSGEPRVQSKIPTTGGRPNFQ